MNFTFQSEHECGYAMLPVFKYVYANNDIIQYIYMKTSFTIYMNLASYTYVANALAISNVKIPIVFIYVRLDVRVTTTHAKYKQYTQQTNDA